jgi:hypothetical protein
MKGKGTGYLYLNENCWRAMKHLINGKGPKWRKRIGAAILDAHRPGDDEFYTQWMSPKTLEAWRGCMTERRFDDLSHRQVVELAENLAAFIVRYQRDDGAREARQKTPTPSKRRRLG